MKRRAFECGFTIIELMTVLVIAGVLLVIALPSFNDMLARRRVEGQANELVTDLAYAKSEAVQRNRNVALFTGGGGTCYTIAVWTTGTGSCNCACTGGPVQLKTVALNNGVAVTDGVTFDFEPVRGALQPATAASAAVSLGSRTYTVSVTAYGRVTPFGQ
jgi:type IV fimbrial biogenesis protein FimT